MVFSTEINSRIEAAKRAVIAAGKYLGSRQYHAALAGNISARISEELILCTRHGAAKEALRPDDLLVCDLDGHKIEGAGEPTSEFNMHRVAYAMRPEVGSVVHAHPPTATAFAAASVPLDQLQLPEMLVLLGPVALVPYATPGSEALARQVAGFLPGHDAFLLENHGALTVGRSARQAALRMELIEQNARITLMLRDLGKPFVLPPGERDILLGFRPRMATWACEVDEGQDR
ncbi:MAG: class II aldolase/adducin family protein [Acidobacteria bacterium]|nr:class II aldolase/adducin family protein [Acidobacteriota bacterium]